jgi:hypothetical protein
MYARNGTRVVWINPRSRACSVFHFIIDDDDDAAAEPPSLFRRKGFSFAPK